MDIKDDVNKAGDVEVLNAMFEFPMPPTVESVLRIAADGSRIRISANGSIYPVPPAGDAEESVADVVMFEGGKIIDGTLAYMETAVVGDRLYSTAHVTRLTAERDRLQRRAKNAELALKYQTENYERTQAELDKIKADSKRLAELDDQTIKQLGDRLRESQAELNKAQELILWAIHVYAVPTKQGFGKELAEFAKPTKIP